VQSINIPNGVQLDHPIVSQIISRIPSGIFSVIVTDCSFSQLSNKAFSIQVIEANASVEKSHVDLQ
jgi:hypothetical protein